MTMSVDDQGEAYREFENDDSIPQHVRQLYLDSLANLKTAQQRTRLARILTDYEDCFARHADDIGRTHLIKHVIETGDAKPV